MQAFVAKQGCIVDEQRLFGMKYANYFVVPAKAVGNVIYRLLVVLERDCEEVGIAVFSRPFLKFGNRIRAE